MRVIRPSPARAAAPEPDVWLPILDVTGELAVLDLAGEFDSIALEETRHNLDRELAEIEADFWRTAPSRLEDAVALIDVPTLFPLERPTRAAFPHVEFMALQPVTPVAVRPSADLANEQGTIWIRYRRRMLETALVVCLVAAIATIAPSFLAPSPPVLGVTLTVDGTTTEIETRSSTVKALMVEHQVHLGAADRTIPAAGQELSTGIPVRVLRAFPMTLDVDGSKRTVDTTRRSISGLKRELGLATALRVVEGAGPLASGDVVVLRSPDDVTLVADGVTTPISDALETNVGELLAARGMALGPRDSVVPIASALVTDGMTVTVQRGQVPQPSRSSAKRTQNAVAPKPSSSTKAAPVPLTTPRQTGSATWYGTGPGRGTCAHLSLPFGTIVTLTYQGRTATCRVADRGPQAWTGHVIDLSPDVFGALAPLGTGILHGIQLST